MARDNPRLARCPAARSRALRDAILKRNRIYFLAFFGGEMDCVHASILALSKSPLAPIRQHHRPEHTAFCFAESPQSLVVKKRFGFCSKYLLAFPKFFVVTDRPTDGRTDGRTDTQTKCTIYELHSRALGLQRI